VKNTAKTGRGRSVEEAVSYALGHRVRIEVLAALNERAYSTQQLAGIVHEQLSTVAHHVKELLKSGSIEVAKTEQVRNISQYFYRAVELPFFSDEEMEAMAPTERQEVYGVVLQAVMAEALASFWAGKISADPRAMLAWRWFNVDSKGRADIADEQARSWERVQEIEAESSARRTVSGEDAQSIIVTQLGYERSRTPPNQTSGFGKS
jgi:predicted transcriptional regulator